MALENTELDEIIAAKVKEALESASGVEKPVVAGPEKITILGKTYEFNNRAEMEAALSQTFQKAAEQVEEVRNQPAPQKEGSYVTGKEAPTFSQEHYIDLMGKGPKGILDAFNYGLNHSIFEGKSEDASKTIRESLAEANTLKQTVAVYQFRERHPEFQLTTENTKIIDGLRNELGQGFTLQGLEAAYGVAQSRGLFPSPQVLSYQQELIKKGILPDPTQQTQQTQPQGQESWRNAPPPSISRTTTTPNANLADIAENLTFEELEKALRKAGQL